MQWHHLVLCACLQIFFHSFFSFFSPNFMKEKMKFSSPPYWKNYFPNFHFTAVRQSLTIFTWMSKLKTPPSYVLHKAGNQILKFTRWLWKISTDLTLTFPPDLWYDRERECIWVERRGKYLQRIFTITFAKEKNWWDAREKPIFSWENRKTWSWCCAEKMYLKTWFFRKAQKIKETNLLIISTDHLSIKAIRERNINTDRSKHNEVYPLSTLILSLSKTIPLLLLIRDIS